MQDFEAIGIDKRGYVLRLEQAAKRLPKMTIETVVPVRLMIDALSMRLM